MIEKGTCKVNNKYYNLLYLDGVKTKSRSLSSSPRISWSAMGLSGLEASFLHLGTKTVISRCPFARNQSTQILMPLQEKISLFPWLIATLLPSITTGRKAEELDKIAGEFPQSSLDSSVVSKIPSASSRLSASFDEQVAPSFISSAKSSFWPGSGPNLCKAAWTKRSV